METSSYRYGDALRTLRFDEKNLYSNLMWQGSEWAPEESEESMSGYSFERKESKEASPLPLQELPPGPWRSLGKVFDYREWPERERFLALDRELVRLKELQDEVSNTTSNWKEHAALRKTLRTISLGSVAERKHPDSMLPPGIIRIQRVNMYR